MEEERDEMVRVERTTSSIALTGVALLMSLYGDIPQTRARSLTAGVSKYKRHQGKKEMERRKKV